MDAREEPAIAAALLQLLDQHAHAFAAGCLFDQPDDQFEIRAESDLIGNQCFFIDEGAQPAQPRDVGQVERRCPRRRSQQPPACHVHGETRCERMFSAWHCTPCSRTFPTAGSWTTSSS